MPDHIGRTLRHMRKVRFKESEAAQMAGVSLDTLRRWRRAGKFTPSDTMEAGDITVYLYSEKDIDKLKQMKR